MASICLISPYHVSLQPRVLREADSLYQAGHDVRVVFRQVDSLMAESDTRLLRTRKWRYAVLDLRKSWLLGTFWLFQSLRSKFYQWVFNTGLKTINVGVNAYLKGLKPLIELAQSEKSDWFIAHTQAALPLAAWAAKRWGARLGFDCEDLLAENGTDPPEVVRLIEKRFLHRCDYISVPSEQIRDRLVKDYKIRPPIVLYNVFPLHLAEGLVPLQQRPKNSVIRLHWFGQTIGPGRGIEEAVIAMRMLKGNVELHLLGRISEEYRSKLMALARSMGAASDIKFHPLVDHENLIKTIGEYDVGLALERLDRKNYALTVTNKLFGYLMAGLAVAATDTPGQREILEKIPNAGFLYPAGDPKALADGLRRWLNDYDSLRLAQQAAWDAARERYCWDVEKEKLFKVLGISTPARLETMIL